MQFRFNRSLYRSVVVIKHRGMHVCSDTRIYGHMLFILFAYFSSTVEILSHGMISAGALNTGTQYNPHLLHDCTTCPHFDTHLL